MPYKLSVTLQAHTSDVRAVDSPTNDLILSASRDTTAIAWQRQSSNTSFSPVSVLRAGSRYVNAISYIPPTDVAPRGYIVTGGQDTVVNVFNLSKEKDEPDFTLVGHTENVCALYASPGGTIISGSWDSTAKVWKNFQLAYTLKGHQYSVWAVLIVDEDQYLTASADKTIKLWQQGKAIATYTGHTDAVRGLAIVPDIGFASCSNDSEIRVWTMGGDLVYTLSGHTSFVYSVSVLPSGDIVSAGEDRSVRVWKDGECSQVIIHPVISVWAVSTMPNGDIVSGSSDGVVRVFSSSEERWASAGDLKIYEEKISKQAIAAQEVGKVNASPPEALNLPGKKPGEVKMIRREGTLVEAYQWDAMASKWEKIGEVVDAVGQDRKQIFEGDGKEYDYVFSVDIKDGVPPLKLPYNATENPYVAAQRFLEKNELPLSYIDQVVEFIQQNTKGVDLGTTDDQYVDPFTGASRYRRNSGPTAPRGNSSSYVDPYTGNSRYTGAPPTPSNSSADTTYMDPYTGASRYSGSAPQPTVSPRAPLAKLLPAYNPVPFKAVRDIRAIQNKLTEFNNVLQQNIATSHLAMNSTEISSIDDIVAHVSSLISTPQASSTLAPVKIDVIVQILERWPASQCFPVIDLSRLVIAYCSDFLSLRHDLLSRLFEACFQASEWQNEWLVPLPKPRDTNILLTLRALCNAFLSKSTADLNWLSQVIAILQQANYTALGKNQRSAFVTVLFNISCQGLQSTLPAPIRNQIVALLLKNLQFEDVDAEPVYRGLAALGNTLYAVKTKGPSLESLQLDEIRQVIVALPAKFNEERVRNIVQEITNL